MSDSNIGSPNFISNAKLKRLVLLQYEGQAFAKNRVKALKKNGEGSIIELII